MRIIAYKVEIESRQIKILESTGESCVSAKLDTLFSFLCEPFDEALRVCWDLDIAVAPLIKLLGEERARKLWGKRKLYCPPYKLFYVPEKVFMVKHTPTHNTCNLYHLAQYYPDLDEPETVEEVQFLGEALVRELRKMGLKPSKLTSPVAIYEDSVMRHLDLPTFLDMPKGACEYAYECSGRLWTECYQIGFWE